MAPYKPSAADVKALRDRTGAGMMDCKAALTEAEGDLEEAIRILRRRGPHRPPSEAGGEQRRTWSPLTPI